MAESQEPVHINVEENKESSFAFINKHVGNNVASAA